jgi:hypothetical protein
VEEWKKRLIYVSSHCKQSAKQQKNILSIKLCDRLVFSRRKIFKFNSIPIFARLYFMRFLQSNKAHKKDLAMFSRSGIDVRVKSTWTWIFCTSRLGSYIFIVFIPHHRRFVCLSMGKREQGMIRMKIVECDDDYDC